MSKLKILVVEDDITITEGLKYLLQKENYEPYIITSQKEAIEFINTKNFDIALLDVQLPDGTGFEICKHIKQIADKPIIFISGRTEEVNIIYGLDIGADDYIIKPYRNYELISRIKSVLRRYNNNNENGNIIKYRNIKVDIEKANLYKDLEEVFLTNLEYRILLMFLNNINRLITREEILEKVWDIDANFVNDNTLSVYIKRLRLKIGDNDETQMIKTIRGIGYILNK